MKREPPLLFQNIEPRGISLASESSPQVVFESYPDMLKAVSCCDSRMSLEKLIGSPVSISRGDSRYSMTEGEVTWSPDVVEVYVVGQFEIHFWFKESRLQAITGNDPNRSSKNYWDEVSEKQSEGQKRPSSFDELDSEE